MIALRGSLAACALACLLTAGAAAPAAAEDGIAARPPHLGDPDLWSLWPGAADWLSSPAVGPLVQWGPVAPKGFRPGRYRPGKVGFDPGSSGQGFGVEDSVAIARAGRVRIDIRDLLGNDLGWTCDWPCKPNKTNKLDLTAFGRNDNIKSIVQKGKFLYVEAEERRSKSTFVYQVFDKQTGARADVRVNVWFGNRAPQARADKLAAFANTTNVFDVADLLGNDRDRDGDLLDLVRVWCPKDGRVFVRELGGELKIFFQPDEGFTGATYFRYAIADLSDPGDILVTGSDGESAPARKTSAEGVVRVQVLASPS